MNQLCLQCYAWGCINNLRYRFFYFYYMDSEHEHKMRLGSFIKWKKCFIGLNCMIIYSGHIGNNVMGDEGGLLKKDILSSSITTGVPCKSVGWFNGYKKNERIMLNASKSVNCWYKSI